MRLILAWFEALLEILHVLHYSAFLVADVIVLVHVVIQVLLEAVGQVALEVELGLLS